MVKELRGGSVSLVPKGTNGPCFFFFPEAYNPPSGFSCRRQSFSRRSPTVAVHFFSGFKSTTKGPGQKIKLDRKTPIKISSDSYLQSIAL